MTKQRVTTKVVTLCLFYKQEFLNSFTPNIVSDVLAWCSKQGFGKYALPLSYARNLLVFGQIDLDRRLAMISKPKESPLNGF
jgi:hypothetical protein